MNKYSIGFGIGLGVVVALLFGVMGPMANPKWMQPIASKVSCKAGYELTTRQKTYSYRPGHDHVAVDFMCCTPKGKCHKAPGSMTLVLVFFGVALIPACIGGLLIAGVFGGIRKVFGHKAVLWLFVGGGLIGAIYFAFYAYSS